MCAPDCLHRFFRLDKDQIGYVKFVVEAYEGIAQVSSRAGRGRWSGSSREKWLNRRTS